MKRTLCCLALLMAIGCSQTQSPTAPTATTPAPTPTASGPTVLNLQWGVMALGSCPATSLPPAQPAFADAMLTDQTDAGVTASWPYQSPTRNGRLIARFVNMGNNTWGLCSWDIADI